MSALKTIAEDECLLDVDEAAWRSVIEDRGGCRCHISPPCNACTEPISEEELNRVGYTLESAAGQEGCGTSQQPEKWSAYFDGAERVTIHDTEGEAVGEMMRRIDDNFEPGTEVEYCVAKMVNGLELLQRREPFRVGSYVFEQLVDDLADTMGAEDEVLDLTNEDLTRLGELVVDFIVANAKPQWWTMDTKTEQKRTYVAGSNDAQEGGAQ